MKVLSATVHGVKANNELNHWIPMCHSWAFNIERYARLTIEGDAPYDNNERANVGLLAGAAWSCGNVALEEFQTTKGIGTDEKNGRIDLWLCDENTQEEYVEAKFKRMSVNGDFVKNISSVLKAATDDAMVSKGDQDIDGIGVAFIVFYLKAQKVNEILEKMDEVLSTTISNVDHDLISWCFPEKDLKHVFEDGYTVPGIVMIAKKVK